MKKPSRSILQRLLIFLVTTVLLAWLTVSFFVIRAARYEVEQVFDADLLRSTRILSSALLHEIHQEQETKKTVRDLMQRFGYDSPTRDPEASPSLQDYMGQDHRRVGMHLNKVTAGVRHKYESELAFVALYPDGTVMLSSNEAPDFSEQPLGFSNFRQDGIEWRVNSLREPKTGFVVHMGERTEVRNELVEQITRNTLTPMFIALPVVALLIVLAVRGGMRPLRRIAQEVGRRAPDSFEPIAEKNVPSEIHVLLTALNQLFGRVRDALQREQRFTADAAHELRTPLAGLKAHLQVARNQTADDAVRHSLDQALEGVDRATHSVQQLLALTRVDADRPEKLQYSSINLRETAANVVSELSQQAIDRNIDLGLEASGPVVVKGDESLLQILVRNLVDNAVRYTQPGGMVTVVVGLEDDYPSLRVVDDGPGIDELEMPKLFDRFRRGAEQRINGTSGSGLGLSIVQRVVELHGASLDVGKGVSDRGTAVTIRFPSPDSGQNRAHLYFARSLPTEGNPVEQLQTEDKGI